MIILGIDPGYAIIGHGVISASGSRYTLINYGAIKTDPCLSFTRRIEIIYDSITEILMKYDPDIVSIERLYFQNNHKTAIDVAQARGVILLAAKKAGKPVYEYTPLQIKMSITGYGQAKKQQIMEMTKRLLRLNEVPRPDDAADALGVAICHGNTCSSSLKTNIRRILVKEG